MNATDLVDHFFRHEYGRLVAMLTSRVGVEFIEDVEDAAQSALMKAMESWTISGLPETPSAWLFHAAHNHLIGTLRTHSRRKRLLENAVSLDVYGGANPGSRPPCDEHDDLLRMLFISCEDSIALQSQLVFTLKTLCGFSIREIAIRLFTTDANVYKRLARARHHLNELPPPIDELTQEQCTARLPAIQRVLYVMFTEGYLSSDGEVVLRRDLCHEAIRLATILAEHPAGESPDTFALVALMHFQLSRMNARENTSGDLLFLEEQNRSLWDQDEIHEGLTWLERSASGHSFSRYHAEAGIAAEHCLAPSFGETRWEKIAETYELLEQIADVPIHKLNRAVAVAEWKGATHGLAVLNSFEPPTWLAGSYQWAAVLADLYRRCGKLESARRYREIALELSPTAPIRRLLGRRLGCQVAD